MVMPVHDGAGLEQADDDGRRLMRRGGVRVEVRVAVAHLAAAMANRSFTMKVSPASGPDAAPGKGSRKVWGTRAPTGSADGTEIIVFSLCECVKRPPWTLTGKAI